MTIDLKKCAQEPLHVERRLDVAPVFAAYPEIDRLADVEVVLNISREGATSYRLGGGLRAAARAVCSRCVEPFDLALERRFTLHLRPEHERAAGDVRLRDQDIDVGYYADERLALMPILEEQLNLSFPMRFICGEGCRGLCPQCGTNRNRNLCACVEPHSDSPFEGLRQLLH